MHSSPVLITSHSDTPADRHESIFVNFGNKTKLLKVIDVFELLAKVVEAETALFEAAPIMLG